MMEEILENVKIERIAKNFRRAPHQRNKIHEADAELIDLGKGYEKYLAITTDALVEEVTSGLYDDPYLIGWMLAMVNFSDLAAVGADPLGLLISVNLPLNHDDGFVTNLTKGISDACQKLNTFVLGGDTNQGEDLLLSGCAVGLVPKKSFMTRVGAKPGDRIYLSGPAGVGSIFAFLKFTKKEFPLPESLYQPEARIGQGRIIREFAHCCMDTSDGVMHTLDTLMRLNRCQFVLNNDWETILHPIAFKVCRSQSLPPWLALAAVHGEFELCFSLSPRREKSFLQEAARVGWIPVLIGEVREGLGVGIQTEKEIIPVDTTQIRNLSESAGSDPEKYIIGLLDIGLKAGI